MLYLLITYSVQAIKYLSAAGFGAKLLGVFGNGMVQSFINARTLTPAGKHGRVACHSTVNRRELLRMNH